MIIWSFTEKEVRMIGNLIAASTGVLAHGPCGDPDCCRVAVLNTKARSQLQATIAEMEDKGLMERVWKSH